MDGDGDVGDADHAPADHHDDHGDDGFPGTTEDSGGTVGEGQQEIEQRTDTGFVCAEPDGLRLLGKGRDQQRCRGKDRHTDKLCDEH